MILICRVLDCWIDFRSCIEIVMLQELDVQPHRFDERRDYIASMVLHIDFFSKKKVTQTPYNTDDMAKEFLNEFHNSAFTVGQPYVFQFLDKPLTQVLKLFSVVH